MKFILICTVLTNILLATTITCKNKYLSNSIYQLSQLQSSILTNQGELDNGLLFGDIDPANSTIAYYDNSSAVCGGKENYNRLVESYCDYNIDDCWDIKLGQSGFNTLIQKEDNYTNNVILVNGLPCLPYNVSNVTVGFYDYDNNDIGFANFLLTNIESENTIVLSESEARSQREYCPNLLKYIDEWETKLDEQNLSLNQTLTSINSIDTNSINQRVQNIDNSIQNINTSNNNNTSNTNEDYTGITDTLKINPNINLELDGFKSDIENSLENTFSSYSNALGFSGYGSAPDSINFTMLGTTYSAFDIKKYDEHLPLIRNTFLAFAYVWGFILTIRTLS